MEDAADLLSWGVEFHSLWDFGVVVELEFQFGCGVGKRFVWIFFVFLAELSEVMLDVNSLAKLLLQSGLVVLFLTLMLAEVDGREVRGKVRLIVVGGCLLQGSRFGQLLWSWDAGRDGNTGYLWNWRSAEIPNPASILMISLNNIPAPHYILSQSFPNFFPFRTFPLLMKVRDILPEQTVLLGVLTGPRPSLLIEGLDNAVLFWGWFLFLELQAGAAVIVLRQHHVFLNINITAKAGGNGGKGSDK